jgi:signal transduction histidine kinase
MNDGNGASDLALLLSRLDELRHAERRAASARMVSVAGHLIGTPLNVIAGRAALIRSNPSAESVEENVRRIEEQVERLAQRIRRLIDYFGMGEPQAGSCSVGDMLEECSTLYGPIAHAKGVELNFSAQGLEALKVDDTPTALVLTTLLSLAVRTAKSGATVSLSVAERGPRTLGFELTLPGLSSLPKNFERFEPPEQAVRYDAGTLETFWLCLGLARRAGGSLEGVVAGPSPGDVPSVRYQCGIA